MLCYTMFDKGSILSLIKEAIIWAARDHRSVQGIDYLGPFTSGERAPNRTCLHVLIRAVRPYCPTGGLSIEHTVLGHLTNMML